MAKITFTIEDDSERGGAPRVTVDPPMAKIFEGIANGPMDGSQITQAEGLAIHLARKCQEYSIGPKRKSSPIVIPTIVG